MNPERLLAHFETISEAPDAVARLRRFILDLAVRGKLVEQDPEDEPAEFSLPAVSRRNRRGVELTAEIKHCLPPGWTWRPVSAIAETVTDGEHATPKRISEPVVPLVTAKNVREGYMDYSKTDWVSRETALKAWSRCRPQVGDLLMVCVGATTGRLTVLREARDMVLVRSVALIRPSIISDSDYLEYAIRSPALQSQIWAGVKAAAQPCLYLNRINSLLIPLPPLAEQHRIVAKVDELMAFCDQLEAARQEREQSRERLVAATVQRLNQPSEDPASFRNDASFALRVLPSLTTTPAQIKQLRRTILNLAVRGKLVDGAQAALHAVGKYRKLQNGYAFKSGWFSRSGVPLLRNANIGHGEIRWLDVVRLPEDRFFEFSRFSLEEGDIVLALDRPFIATGTKVARVSASDLPSLLLQRVGRFLDVAPGLDDDYLFLWINSPHFDEQIDPGRSNGVPHISSKQVEGASLFVPPLAEQHRIVAKVDELMALCDQLEQQLSQADQQRRRLLEAVLAEALDGRHSVGQDQNLAAAV